MSARTRYPSDGCIGGLRLPLCQVAGGGYEPSSAAPNPYGVKWLILPQKTLKVLPKMGYPQGYKAPELALDRGFPASQPQQAHGQASCWPWNLSSTWDRVPRDNQGFQAGFWAWLFSPRLFLPL
jgi:hypothetical protein